ncbi:MAG: hypothetical protein JO150_13480 [Acidobacteriaceae bacterium]|nr:hypothetical protein [Acidobacteriaceae bacterium]
MRTAKASWPTFLPKPAALRTNGTGRKRINNGREYLHDAGCQAAVCSIKMAASLFFAGGRKPENLSWMNGSGKGE